jgi:hypothetical protein
METKVVKDECCMTTAADKRRAQTLGVEVSNGKAVPVSRPSGLPYRQRLRGDC